MRFQGLSVTIAESGVVEFGLLPESSPRIFGIDIFASPNAFRDLCEKDGSPREFVGFVVLLNLGITMTGFHDGQSEQLAVTAFAKGRWDELQSHMKPFAAR